ncbi:hypothetical protein [Phenylobacterium sp. J367]|uniref:hypothetical protein n=1 Tax=Phenylobacterium sp. J367 TaxID=2898435 RepID=UPI002151514F|nr:hypothetical protein [Phenylobacterium sp. J367]MCR5879577.1 hypothetical protein [Phenylobacterium sp. J367]
MITQRSFPGGRYRITRAEDAALREAIGAGPDPDGRAHPIFYYIASQAEMGISVADLCALCDFDVADGPMMATSKVEFADDLRVEHDYDVSGEILSLVRKPSRTFGALDLLTYRLTLSEAGGRAVVSCVNEWVLPRREDRAS